MDTFSGTQFDRFNGPLVLMRRFKNVALSFLLCIGASSTPLFAQRASRSFSVEETTIAQIHAAMHAHQLTCRQLVDAYLERIDAYDKRGPAINSLVVLNPNATKEADELDRRFAQAGLVGPLHCIPAIVKDKFETIGMQSADGSLSLQGFISNKDAFQVRKIKEAGAIVLAKSNMAKFAFSPYETVNSILPGYTRNGVLPAGLTFFGRAWDESTLIRLAYGYEQVTHHIEETLDNGSGWSLMKALLSGTLPNCVPLICRVTLAKCQ
jgi:Asp-tRNA(Asn)/Glu-tRNA(Gln) amidotransferase A subunit family amidase